MILELDCGNSLIKWRSVDERGTVVHGGIASDHEELLHQLGRTRFRACRLVSVRNRAETTELIELLKGKLGIAEVAEACSSAEAGGVKNGYAVPEGLGQDRWLALLGARRLTAKACLVIDLGTAVTADLLTASGVHLGGYICPGMSLLRGQLQKHTRRIRYAADEAVDALKEMAPGRNTMEAVERGCRAMLRGFVLAQLEIAERYLGPGYDLLLTGGDAALIGPLPVPVRMVPDLVFIGLGIACPLEEA